MQGIFQKENTDKALKYGIYRHLPTYEKIIRNLVSFLKTEIQTLLVCLLKLQDETVIKQTDSEQEALYKLRCRIISCKIAKELYVRGIKSDIVDGWKRISENKNEFIEIRNVVFDTTGDE